MGNYRPTRSDEPTLLSRVAHSLGLGSDAEEADTTSDLDAWLEQVLKDELGMKTVERDEDGDIPLQYGSTVLFIRQPEPESPFLVILAPLLHDFAMSPDVYEAVNSINLQVDFARTTVDAESCEIVMSVEVPLIDPLSSDGLMFAIKLLGEAADHFDTLLHKRFGGRTMLEDDDDEIDV